MLFSEIKEGNGTADTKTTQFHNMHYTTYILVYELKYATNKESTYDYDTSYDKDFTILWGKNTHPKD